MQEKFFQRFFFSKVFFFLFFEFFVLFFLLKFFSKKALFVESVSIFFLKGLLKGAFEKVF